MNSVQQNTIRQRKTEVWTTKAQPAQVNQLPDWITLEENETPTEKSTVNYLFHDEDEDETLPPISNDYDSVNDNDDKTKHNVWQQGLVYTNRI